jgi:hypothetical protein
MFEFKDENKENNIQKAIKLLKSLEEKIDILKSIEIGLNFDLAPRAMDLSIYTLFDTKDDLTNYATDPEHLKVVEFLKEVTSFSKVVDYIK